VLGNWGADQRNFGDGVGARSQMLRVGWEPPFRRLFGGENPHSGEPNLLRRRPSRLFSRGRRLPYHRYYDFSVRYSRPWKGLTIAGKRSADATSTASRLRVCQASCATAAMSIPGTTARLDEDSYDGAREQARRGAIRRCRNQHQQSAKDVAPEIPIVSSKIGVDPHVGLGARRAVSANNDLGVRVELDEVDGHSLIGFAPSIIGIALAASH